MKHKRKYIENRLNELKNIESGWDGEYLSSNNLNWFTENFLKYYPKDLSNPYIYPTDSGGIQLEWTIDEYEISLNINFKDHSAMWHSLNMNTDEENVKNLNLDFENDWNWFANEIKKLENKFFKTV